MDPSGHILIIRLSAMGDVAMTIPVIKALRLHHPALKITMLSQAKFEPLFQGIENLNYVHADIRKRHKGINGLYQLSRALKKLDIDAVADLHNVLRSKILRRFLSHKGIKCAIIDKGRAEKKRLIANQPKSIAPLKTTHERYADVFRKLGYELQIDPKRTVGKLDLNPLIDQLIGVGYKKWIGIAPFAQHQPKMYPIGQMMEVITYLSKKADITILLFGGGEHEVKELQEIAQGFHNVKCIAGQLTFDEEIRLLSNLDLMVSMDSANGHLAANYGVNTITLWGATHPYAGFAPLNQPSENQLFPDQVKYPNLPSSVFGKSTFKGYEKAMESIEPILVVKTIEKILNQ